MRAIPTTRRRARRGIAALVVLWSLLLGELVLLPARPARAAASGLEVRLLDFPSWTGLGDTLQVVLQVTNKTDQPVADLQARVAFYPSAASRSDLEAALTGHRRGKANDPRALDTLDLADILSPGETRTVTLAKPLSSVSFLARQADGVLPVRITVSGEGAEAPPLSMPLVYFNNPAELPLGLALVIPLHIPAVYDESGLVVPARLRNELGGGRITRILDGLQSYPGVPVTIAPSALLLDTLADLSDGYTAATRSGPATVGAADPSAIGAAVLLARIRELAARPQTRVVVMPYSGARLPRLVSAGLTDRADAQVSAARLRLRAVLGVEPLAGWVLPVQGDLDSPTLSSLADNGLAHTIVRPDAVSSRSDSKLTAGARVTLTTRDGHAVRSLVEDPGLEQRLVGDPERPASVTRQRFLAETAALMLEQPGRRRAAVAVAPLDWAPSDATVGGILDALARSPWMRASTPDMVLADRGMPKPPSAAIAGASSLSRPEGSLQPSADYFSSLREARRMIDQYADLRPPPERLALVETNLLIAESADWWTGRSAIEHGTGYAKAVGRIVRGEFAKIRAPRTQRITLTAHEGVIPIQVRSEVGYPVDVVIRLDSDKLGFPDGMRLRRLLLPRGQNIEVRAIAKTTGTFPVRVVVETPGHGVVLGSTELVVRSTGFNVVGLAITAGAAFFLVVWWAAGTIRRRVARSKPAEAPA